MPKLDLDDLKGQYTPPKLTQEDHLRIREKRLYRDFLRDLHEMGISKEEYEQDELVRLTARRGH